MGRNPAFDVAARKRKFLTPLSTPQEKNPSKDADERKLPTRRDAGAFRDEIIFCVFPAKGCIFVDETASVHIIWGVVSFD